MIVQLSQFHIVDVDAYDNTREDVVSVVLYDGFFGLYRFFSSNRAYAFHGASSSSPLPPILKGLMGSSTTFNSFALRAHFVNQLVISMA